MKLIRMHVDNFGGLHNYDYSFEEGLNVVLQDNGWGKTTMAAFLKAMLYGFDSKRSKDITENERKRYLPWQGGNYGGSLDFEADGVNYRIIRTFGATPRFDKTKILNLDRKTTARIDPEKIGETFFKLDASAFQRSVFINQNGLSIDGAASSIHTRLNALVSQANDVAAYDGAINSLTQQVKVYEKTGARGQIGDLTRQITVLENQRDQLEAVIARQDSARNRIVELDTLLSSINKEQAEKKENLERVSGEAKKSEASRELIRQIDEKIAVLKDQLESIRRDLGGEIPSADEIDQIKRQNQVIATLKSQTAETEEEYTKAKSRHLELLERYDGKIPAAAQLDQIQGIYGELQGAKSTDNERMPDIGAETEGYTLINGIMALDESYPDKLSRTIGTQTMIRHLVRILESHDRDIQREEEKWGECQKRYASLKEEVNSARAGLEGKERYESEKTAPIISKLESLDRLQQTVEVKKEELSRIALTPDESGLLAGAPEELPDAVEGNAVLRKFRDFSGKQADVQGLSARLEGEKSKAESLQASVDQINSVSDADISVKGEPSKPAGGVMIGAGAVLGVLGVILLVVVNPAMIALSVIGAILAFIGVNSNSKYKAQLKEYELYKETEGKREEARKRKEDLADQLKDVQNVVSSYEQQIADLNRTIASEQEEVNAWYYRWGDTGTEISDAAIIGVLERAEQTKKAREKEQYIANQQRAIDELSEQIRAGVAEVEAAYPELAGMTISDALSFLRAAETDYRIKSDRLADADRKREQFLRACGVTEDMLAEEHSPRAEIIRAKRSETDEALSRALSEANEVLTLIHLSVSADDFYAVFRKAHQILMEYRQYADKVKGHYERQQRKQSQIEQLEKQLSEKTFILGDNYEDFELPERLARVREDAIEADALAKKIKASETVIAGQTARLNEAKSAVEHFIAVHGRFEAVTGDILGEIYQKAASYTKLDAARKELERQKSDIELKQKQETGFAGTEETELRNQVAALEERYDKLLVEYTQMSDFIRQADYSLEKYPDVVQEIRQLYEQKQKAQNTLVMLKRTILLITKAKENLADRYLSKVEDTFNNYMHVWLNNEAIRGMLDIDFNVKIEEKGEEHVAEGYSTGYCDLIDFCMRLALVDTLFEKEQPFLILDDPFVNLDADRLDKALELLNVMAANKQIIYFVCHPIRAVEVDENAVQRTEFAQLAEKTRKNLEEKKSSGTGRKNVVRKSPKEMYKVIPGAVLPFKPKKPNYTITNNIFSMNFVMNDQITAKDNSYELFFIDAKGHVLNDRQMIEIKNGKLSSERVQFCLNTRDNSGDQFELMIRESGQDDYEVIARLPFKVKLAFAGTFSFDF